METCWCIYLTKTFLRFSISDRTLRKLKEATSFTYIHKKQLIILQTSLIPKKLYKFIGKEIFEEYCFYMSYNIYGIFRNRISVLSMKQGLLQTRFASSPRAVPFLKYLHFFHILKTLMLFSFFGGDFVFKLT